MKITSMPDHLASIPFFAEMSEKHRAVLAGCATNVHFDAGEFLVLEGKHAETFFIVRSGNVAVEMAAPTRGSVTIETLGDGDVLGWSWLIPPYTWRFDARAVTPVSAISFDALCLRQKCEADPAFGYEVLRRFTEIIAQRLTATRMQLMDVYS
jgi:CRP/FNR family transcriptional regulator, cyclic AMP receptor protein